MKNMESTWTYHGLTMDSLLFLYKLVSMYQLFTM